MTTGEVHVLIIFAALVLLSWYAEEAKLILPLGIGVKLPKQHHSFSLEGFLLSLANSDEEKT